jgi:kinetochore protein Nuf2
MAPPIRQAYAFPVLKVAGLVQCLGEIGIEMKEDGLLNPDKYVDDIKSMYENLAEYCIGTTKEELNQPKFAGLAALDYPDLHTASITQLNSFRECGKMMELCGIYDFTMKDFMFPTAKRVRKQLSAIINFAKFRGEKQNMLDSMNDERDNFINQSNQLKSEKNSLNERLVLLREQTANENNIITLLEIKCNDISNQIAAYNEKQAVLREESGVSKTKNYKLKDEIAAKSLNLVYLCILVCLFDLLYRII